MLRDLLDEDPPVRFEIVTTHSRASVRLVVEGDVDLAVVTGQERRAASRIAISSISPLHGSDRVAAAIARR